MYSVLLLQGTSKYALTADMFAQNDSPRCFDTLDPSSSSPGWSTWYVVIDSEKDEILDATSV